MPTHFYKPSINSQENCTLNLLPKQFAHMDNQKCNICRLIVFSISVISVPATCLCPCNSSEDEVQTSVWEPLLCSSLDFGWMNKCTVR
jgi:hypothetical protein